MWEDKDVENARKKKRIKKISSLSTTRCLRPCSADGRPPHRRQDFANFHPSGPLVVAAVAAAYFPIDAHVVSCRVAMCIAQYEKLLFAEFSFSFSLPFCCTTAAERRPTSHAELGTRLSHLSPSLSITIFFLRSAPMPGAALARLLLACYSYQ